MQTGDRVQVDSDSEFGIKRVNGSGWNERMK